MTVENPAWDFEDIISFFYFRATKKTLL